MEASEMTENRHPETFDSRLPLDLPDQDHVFSGTFSGVYLTKRGELYALGVTGTGKNSESKDGKALIARDVSCMRLWAPILSPM